MYGVYTGITGAHRCIYGNKGDSSTYLQSSYVDVPLPRPPLRHHRPLIDVVPCLFGADVAVIGVVEDPLHSVHTHLHVAGGTDQLQGSLF